jgi:hypothetical protein
MASQRQQLFDVRLAIAYFWRIVGPLEVISYSNKCRDLLDPKDLPDLKDFKDFAGYEGFLSAPPDPLTMV